MVDSGIRIVLCDSHEVVRCGVRQMLAPFTDIEIAGETDSAAQCLELLQSDPPHMAVIELDLRDRNGLDLIEEITSTRTHPKVLIFSGRDERQFGTRSLRLGADGFVSKRDSTEQLASAIRSIARGRKHLSGTLAGALADAVGNPCMAMPEEHLAPREFAVFRSIAEGVGLTAIGNELGLSVKTVATYRARVLDKLGARTNADLVRLAFDHNILR